MTDEEDALVRAIRAAPGDLTPRLVYADWLEENGDPDRAAFVRLLVATSDQGRGSGEDPVARLLTLRAGVDFYWARHLETGLTRGGLDLNLSGEPYDIRLAGGRDLSLRRLDQWTTYSGLLEGFPDRRMNDDLIRRALDHARQYSAGGRARVIDPPRVDRPRPAHPTSRVAEWLPTITCVGYLGDAYSDLGVVWFQTAYAPPLDPAVAAAIRGIDWDAEATHRTADDM